MAITGNIETNYINMFREGFEHSFQQKDARFRKYVEVVRQASEFDFYDRLGLADDMQEVTTRYGDTPANDVPHERRRCALQDYDWGKGVDDKDLIRVASDPTNEYTQAAVYAANRRIDNTIITAITADAYTGKAGGTAVSFVGTTAGNITVGAVSNENSNISTAGEYTVTAGNVEGIDVSVDFSAATTNTNISIKKMIAVRETMLRLEAIEDDQNLTWFLAPNQAAELLRITEIHNSDYNTVKVLSNGRVDSFMGFNFVYTNLLPISGTTRDNYVLGPKAVKLAMSKDIDVDIFRRPDKKNIPWIMVKLGLGATRMWGEHVAKVRCDESVVTNI
jgi:hypothetical protein